MKGVIVQVGEPKSIVLFNNGKIGAIPTPADCHVGMVVSVKFNNKLKVILLAFAAVLFIGIGVFIGISFGGSKPHGQHIHNAHDADDEHHNPPFDAAPVLDGAP